MSDPSDPAEPAPAPEGEAQIELVLTSEQQAIIRRMSGKHAAVLELTMDSEDPSEGAGRSLQFRWRLSGATGIPRQVWDAEKRSETEA